MANPSDPGVANNHNHNNDNQHNNRRNNSNSNSNVNININNNINSKEKNGCIINRSREHKGLAGSFSSNLEQQRTAKTAPPCREPRPKAKPAANGFVKALVAKLESSDDVSTMSSASNPSMDSASSRSRPLPPRPASPVSSVSPDTSSCQRALVGEQAVAAAAAPGVEGYSLTLLKYQQYFAAEKPLHRCLDEPDVASDSPKTRVVIRSGGETTPSPQRRSPTAVQGQNKDVDSQVSSGGATPRNNKSSPVDTERTKPPTQESEAQHDTVHRRDPEEVRAFWQHVRDYLAPSDSESEDQDAPRTSGAGKKSADRKTRQGACSPSPHRKASSAPNLCTRTSSPHKKRRFLSVEEKMMEIDEFFETDDSHDGPATRRA